MILQLFSLVVEFKGLELRGQQDCDPELVVHATSWCLFGGWAE